MATKLKVTYSDGREVEILASPRAQVETARHFKAQGGFEGNQLEAGYRLAWASLHYAGKEPADFDAWLDLIADVDEVPLTVDDEKATDPTPATPASIGSSG
jgi:hypothetical protein